LGFHNSIELGSSFGSLVEILLTEDFSFLLHVELGDGVLQASDEEGVVCVFCKGLGEQVFVLLDGSGVGLDGRLQEMVVVCGYASSFACDNATDFLEELVLVLLSEVAMVGLLPASE